MGKTSLLKVTAAELVLTSAANMTAVVDKSAKRRRMQILHPSVIRIRLKGCGVKSNAVESEEEMARGWESKSIESQVEAAESRRESRQAPQMTAAEAERVRQRESLLLSRTRVLRDLQETQNVRYRETLSAALRHLDEKLAELE